MLIDNMDQRKTVVPCVWSQLATPLFKEVGRRLMTGLNGSMWFGTIQTTHHLRTVFDDCQHGAEMQKQHFLVELAPGRYRRGFYDNALVQLRRQYTQGDNKSVHYAVYCAVVVRIGQHATLEDRCIVLNRGAHTQQVG